jgi:DNA-binding transcriptional LysR family regulator
MLYSGISDMVLIDNLSSVIGISDQVKEERALDLKTLNCFVTIAEELHFRHAAARLNMTQPSLTARIQGLEREIDAKLFDRDRRGVQLTASGRAFLDHARAAVLSGKEAVSSAQRAASGEIGHLRFGFTGLTSYAGMPELIRRFKRAYPDVAIELIHLATADLEIALLKGEVDIALLHPPLTKSVLAQKEVEPDPLVVALPASHKLAKLSIVPLEKLAGEPFLICPRSSGPFLYDQIILACHRVGFSPSIVQEATFMTTIIGLVAAGIGCGLVPRSLQVIRRPGVTFRPLAGKHKLQLATALAWRDGEISPVTGRMLHIAGAGEYLQRSVLPAHASRRAERPRTAGRTAK